MDSGWHRNDCIIRYFVLLVRCSTDKAIIIEVSFPDGLIIKRQVLILDQIRTNQVSIQKEVVNRKNPVMDDRFVNLRRKPFQQEMAPYSFKWDISLEGRSK
jgi:hypothetical protein